LRGLRDSGRIDYVLLAGEGIDNALDAGATDVSVEITDKEVHFRDNGAGISRTNLSSIFTLGLHGPMHTSRLGRFGVGIKLQALRTGNIFEVSTVSADGRVQARVSWPDLLRSQDWEIADPRWRPVAVGTRTGTEIVVSELRELPKVSIEQMRMQIAMRFHPALAAGVRIFYNGQPIEVLPEPPMQDVIERQIQLSGGRSAHIRAGMLTGLSPLTRVHVAFRHRVIMPSSGLGCGTYSGLNRIFARVYLAGPWHLGQFKDDLPDEGERGELDEASHEILQPLLAQCQDVALEHRLEKATAEINDMLPMKLASRPRRSKTTPPAGNPKRRPRRQPGEVAPEKSDAANTGPARAKKPAAYRAARASPRSASAALFRLERAALRRPGM